MYRKLKGMFGNVPVRLVATVLVAILIPSLLVTALGLVAALQADRYVAEQAVAPFGTRLQELRRRVSEEWNLRFDSYAERLLDAGRRPLALARFRRDPWVRDIVLGGPGGLRRVPRAAPLPELWYGEPDAALESIRARERLHDLPGAVRDAYLDLAARTDREDVRLEALLGAMRAAERAGEREEALAHLDELIRAYGKTVDDTGVRRDLPLLLRKLAWLPEEREDVRRAVARMVLEILRLAGESLGREAVEHYRSRLRSLAPRELEELSRMPVPALPRLPLRAEHLPLLASGLARGARRGGLGVPVPARFDLPGLGDCRFLSFPTSDGVTVAHVLLDQDRYFEDAELWRTDLGLDDGELLVVDANGTAVGREKNSALGGAFVASIPLPAPFNDLEWRYVPAPESLPPGFRGFEILTLATFTWTVIVLVLTILVGTFLTLRSVTHEMRTARMKADFVSFISHELKTPLAAIRMFTETLLDGRVEEAEERQKCLELIDREGERLASLIDRVLEFSKIQQQRKAFQFSGCSMDDVVEEAIRLFHERNKAPSREVEVQSVQRISAIRMDRASMVELILNLLTNAHKYSPPGTSIVVNLRESIGEISVDVVDRGVGIRKRDQRRIFDQFFRAENYLTRAVDGYGLGLSFARYVARAHGGDIRVTSQYNSGSVFTLSLPKTDVIAE